MLGPNLATQGQFIGESVKGLALAMQDCIAEHKNIAANAKPLQACCYASSRARITHDTNKAIV